MKIMGVSLEGFSADALEKLAKKASQLGADMKAEEPSYELALAAGVSDNSYRTVRYGTIRSYSGEAIVQMANGRQWKAVGHRPSGSPEYVSREGWIEFIPVPAK